MSAGTAEKGVQAAERALEAAEAQLVQLDQEIAAQKAVADEIEAGIEAAIEAGGTPGANDRRKRRDALADVEDLDRERDTVVQLIERRQAELHTARVELAAEREGEYAIEGALLADEVWETLAELTDRWERLSAVQAAQRREIDTMRRGGHPGPNPAGVLSAGGLEPAKGAIGDLVRSIRADLAKRVPA